MNMNKQRFLRDEFIGLTVKIVESKDPTWLHKSGVILDETKNTFLIDTNGQRKRIAKDIATFEFRFNNERIRVHGRDIAYRPEDRIKKVKVKYI
ncbi:MAG: ribonuclease P protein subunit [Thermoplasmata archaeon]|nr:MAG: ribonuclease P protein subunit [Thermoplasmata archaeon]